MQTQEQWELDFVRDRHRWLKLTPKQIRAVWEMEAEDNRMLQARSMTFDRDFFSMWEERDHNLDRWEAILKPDQFKLYKAWMDGNIRESEKQMREANRRDVKEVEYLEANIEWLQKKFLPGFQEEMKMEGAYVRMQVKDKIEFLRAEFLRGRLRRKHENIIVHYRNYRRLQPNTLRRTLLRIDLETLLPDYFSFAREADAGVKAVGQIVLDTQRSWFAHKGELILEKVKPVREHGKALREKFFGDETPKGGWHTVIERKSDLLPAEEAWMSYLLMAANV